MSGGSRATDYQGRGSVLLARNRQEVHRIGDKEMTESGFDHDVKNGDLVEAIEVIGPDSEGAPRRMRGRLQIVHVDALDYDRYSIEGVGVDTSTIRRIAEIEPTSSSETQVTQPGALPEVPVPFRLATWNLNHWQQPIRPIDTRAAAWDFLRSDIKADAALIQETVPPKSLDRSSYVYREIAGHRPWGSAVVSFDPAVSLEEIWAVRTPYSSRRFTIANTYPGSVAIAELSIPGVAPITLVSLYCVMDVYAQTTLLRVIADLVPLFDSAHGSRVILGGDLNLTKATQKELDLRRAKGVLGALESLGLEEVSAFIDNPPASNPECPCGGGGSCRHLLTWKGQELDHLYVSLALRGQVRGLVLRSDAVASGMSDHAPIVLDLALSRQPAPRQWDAATFAEEMGMRRGAAAANAIDKLVAWAGDKQVRLRHDGVRDVELSRFPCSEAVDPEMWLQIDRGGVLGWMNTVSFRALGDVVVQFQYMTHPPFDTTAGREELRQRLAAIGADVPPSRLNGRPAFPLALLERPESFEAFIGVLEWFVDEAVLQVPATFDTPGTGALPTEDPTDG
jgi:endonuclease/exonuclease/phosphatase family metal-dependent hydrolase